MPESHGRGRRRWNEGPGLATVLRSLPAHDSVPFDFLVPAASWAGGPGHSETVPPTPTPR